MKNNAVKLLSAAVVFLLLYPCLASGADDASETIAKNLAEGLAAACPPADPSDARARDLAASKVAQLTLLRDLVSDPILWGSHSAGKSYRPEESSLTAFNSFVWRRMYLPLFMFTGEYKVEKEGDLTLINLASRFRYGLDPGAYPYPFWHAPKKWESYQLATRLILVMQKGKIIAGYRSDTVDPSRPQVSRAWDGRYRWADAKGREMPYVALYSYLFSAKNPHVRKLDAAYRALEAEARQYNCTFCHSPSNPAQMNPLRLLNLPNQALTIRHQIVTQLEENKMPPPGHVLTSAQRQKLLKLARTFAAQGDRALEYEGALKR